jgi:hypothetical protein
MSALVGKLTGQILGLATSNQFPGFKQININSNAAGGQLYPFTALLLSPSLLALLSVGQNVSIYVTIDPADAAAIEAAVATVPIDSST